MSKLNLVAVAIAAALASPAAFATTVTVADGANVGPEVLAQNVFDEASDVASNVTRTMTVKADATSVYLGRNTGYNVRLTLSQGVFAGNPVATNEGDTVSASIAGGGDNQNTVTFSVQPAATGVTEGDGISFAPGAINVDGVAALGNGGQIDVAVQVFDPVGGNQLGATVNATLIRTVQGWAVSFVPGDASQKIDVGAASSKRYFGDENVGSGNAATLFNAGKVEIGYADALTSSAGLNSATAVASLTVTGSDFSAFRTLTTPPAAGSIYLSDAAACTTAGTTIPMTIAANGQSASIAAGQTVDAVDGMHVCFDNNGVTQISSQTLSASAGVTQTGTVAAPAVSGALRAMEYNGPVVFVDHFNPASNPAQESYLRVINDSATAGLVTIDSTCDDGTTVDPMSFTLGAGEARQVNASALEAESGACSGGKRRLTVTGEFATMKVQNFLRNRTSNGVINTNVNNEN